MGDFVFATGDFVFAMGDFVFAMGDFVFVFVYTKSKTFRSYTMSSFEDILLFFAKNVVSLIQKSSERYWYFARLLFPKKSSRTNDDDE
jgi:uncharacterized protein YrrD